MRFGEIYSTCKDIYDCIYENYDIARKANQLLSISNGIETMDLERKIVESISYIEHIFITFEGNEIFESIILDGVSIKTIFKENPKNVNELFNTVEKLVIRIYMIVKVGESVGMKQNELGLDIKMPLTENITDFKKHVDDLEFIFTKCPFFYSDKENLKFKNVDIGSVWLVLAVSGASIAMGSVLLNNIAAFIDKYYIMKSHKLTCEQQKMELEKANMDRKQKEEIHKVLEKIYQISVDNALKDLEKITKIEIKDKDERDRVEQSFNRLEKLMDKGLQIHAAIDSPKEVKALFAPIEMHYLSDKNNISKIEDKSDE